MKRLIFAVIALMISTGLFAEKMTASDFDKLVEVSVATPGIKISGTEILSLIENSVGFTAYSRDLDKKTELPSFTVEQARTLLLDKSLYDFTKHDAIDMCLTFYNYEFVFKGLTRDLKVLTAKECRPTVEFYVDGKVVFINYKYN